MRSLSLLRQGSGLSERDDFDKWIVPPLREPVLLKNLRRFRLRLRESGEPPEDFDFILKAVVDGCPLLEYLSIDIAENRGNQRAIPFIVILNGSWLFLKIMQFCQLPSEVDGRRPGSHISLLEDFIRRHPSLEAISFPWSAQFLANVRLSQLLPRPKSFDVPMLPLKKTLAVLSTEVLGRLTNLSTHIRGQDLFLLDRLRNVQYLSVAILLTRIPTLVDNIPNLVGLRLMMRSLDTTEMTKGEILDPIVKQLARLSSLKYFSIDGWGLCELFGRDFYVSSTVPDFAERTSVEYIRIYDLQMAKTGRFWPWYRILRNSQGKYTGNKLMRNRGPTAHKEIGLGYDDEPLR
ncbi:hypothetical protein M422DRAFT_51626 [Sphaerobolus stellatus SS14]|uniref:Uncharacterized protein n=1 Tax=Sphaerobolus stellatus (strain SS14) TaxID=990650 RepID=A0A0C9UJP8_SPHS4|nr:hypothetical protein M422DRAFT_51626 [Sphaerobolus stellatus SS14]